MFITGAGTGLGKAIAGEYARLGANIVIASRKPEHLAAGEEAITALGAKVITVGCDIRDAEQIASAFDEAEAAFGLPDILINNAAANFPVPSEDMSPNAWRTVVDITLNGTFFCSREFARRHLAAGTPGSIVNVGASYAWTGGPGLGAQRRAKAGREEHGRDARGRVGAVRDPGERPGARPVPARGHDRRHPGQPRPHRREEPRAARAARRAAPGAGLGGDVPHVALRAFISGHTLVVDGANWQRRMLTNPPVVTVRDQMGKGPFEA